MSHRAINDIMQTPKKEVHFFFFSVCCIVFNCSWQLIMFDKKQKSCVNKTYSLCNWWVFTRPKSFLQSKNIFLFILYTDILSQGNRLFEICLVACLLFNVGSGVQIRLAGQQWTRADIDWNTWTKSCEECAKV